MSAYKIMSLDYRAAGFFAKLSSVASSPFIVRFDVDDWKSFKSILLLKIWAKTPYLERRGSFSLVLIWRFFRALVYGRSYLFDEKAQYLIDNILPWTKDGVSWVESQRSVYLHVGCRIDRTRYLE